MPGVGCNVVDDTEKRGDERPGGKSASSQDKSEQNARREALGTGLRRAYQEVLSEPIPDEFSALLARLSDAEDGTGEK